MRILVAAVLFAGACAATSTVTIAPTTPDLRASSRALQVASKRVHVVNGVNVALQWRDAAAAARAASATTAAEAELLAAGWQPVADDRLWTDDDEVAASDARLVIRSVTAGVDRAHPLDGCRAGPHVYAYWVAVAAALVDGGDVKWSAEARATTTDTLARAVSTPADAWTADRCDALLDATELARAFSTSACDDFTANRCDASANLPTLVTIAVRQVVHDLVTRAVVPVAEHGPDTPRSQ